MDRTDELTDIVQREVADYHGPALKDTTYYFGDERNHIYSVVIVPDYEYPRRDRSHVMVLARVVGDTVVIDEDITDRPLFEELMRNGIPREQIVLAYAGETLPQDSDE